MNLRTVSPFSHNFDELLTLAEKAAARAAAVHKDRFDEIHSVNAKSSRTDLVSEVDIAAERVIVDTITRKRPNDAILAEEGGARKGSSGLRWVIDPLDGTVNYLYRYPGFTVSIGLEVDGRKCLGVVHDSYHNRVYTSIVDQFSQCDGKPISVTRERKLSDALLATGFVYDCEQRSQQGSILSNVMGQVRDIRRSGSASLDLCLLASGRVDCYFEAGLKPWDFFAGVVIATTAGAKVLTVPTIIGPSPLLIAAEEKLCEDLFQLLTANGVIDPNEARIEGTGNSEGVNAPIRIESDIELKHTSE